MASLLAGANHEMSRELLWREFPADLRATTFRRFWDRPDVSNRDIQPISDWTHRTGSTTLGAPAGTASCCSSEGDLVMHYPSVRILLSTHPKGKESLPTFGGWIPPDVRFAAFDVVRPTRSRMPARGGRS